MAQLGFSDDIIQLVEYQKTWDYRFQFESAMILLALGDLIMGIEHIGSTAIPGIIAKPIIDILIGIKDLKDVFTHLNVLEVLEYSYTAEAGDGKRRFFKKGSPRLFHLHFVIYESKEWTNHILFRDILLQDEGKRIRYQVLKMELAKKFATKRDKYTDGKTAFINQILKPVARNKK
ncbi:MAG: GrpB family protein [Candidatus Hodarchaeales archaeon]